MDDATRQLLNLVREDLHRLTVNIGAVREDLHRLTVNIGAALMEDPQAQMALTEQNGAPAAEPPARSAGTLGRFTIPLPFDIHQPDCNIPNCPGSRGSLGVVIKMGRESGR